MDARLAMSGITEGRRVSMCAVAAGLRSFAGPQDDHTGNRTAVELPWLEVKWEGFVYFSKYGMTRDGRGSC